MASLGLNPKKQSFPAALLLHRQADGGSHFDLLIADRVPSEPDAATVPTSRIAHRPDLLPAQTTVGLERLPLHRERYLTISEPVVLDRDRGTVSLLRRGSAEACADGEYQVQWDDCASQRIRIECENMDCTLTVLSNGTERGR